MDEKVKKIELYEILKNLILLIKKDEFDDYKKLKESYVKLHKEIFGGQGIEGEERFTWAVIMNKLDGIVFLDKYFKSGKLKREEYEKMKNKYFKECENLEKQIESHLNENKL